MGQDEYGLETRTQKLGDYIEINSEGKSKIFPKFHKAVEFNNFLALLSDSGYQHIKTGLWERGNRQGSLDSVEFFDESNDLSKTEGRGFSYVRFDNLTDPNQRGEMEMFLQQREKRLERGLGVIGGLLVGGISGVSGASILGAFGNLIYTVANNLDDTSELGWVITTAMGVVGFIGGLIIGAENGEQREKRKRDFVNTYQQYISTGKEAIFKAIGYEPKESGLEEE